MGLFFVTVFNVNMKELKPKILINVTSIEDGNYYYFLFPQRLAYSHEFTNLGILVLSTSYVQDDLAFWSNFHCIVCTGSFTALHLNPSVGLFPSFALGK